PVRAGAGVAHRGADPDHWTDVGTGNAMHERGRTLRRALLGALLALVPLAGCATVGGWDPEPDPDSEVEELKHAPMQEIEDVPQRFLERAQGIYVVVDLDRNRLRLMDGGEAL